MPTTIRNTSDIRRLQREAREQAIPSVQTRKRDEEDREIQKALAELSKVIARRTALPPIQDENWMKRYDEDEDGEQ